MSNLSTIPVAEDATTLVPTAYCVDDVPLCVFPALPTNIPPFAEEADIVPERVAILPVDLYRTITEYVILPGRKSFSALSSCQNSLCSLSLTCKDLRVEAQRALFSQPRIPLGDWGGKARFQSFAEIIVQSPDRLAQFVKRITLDNTAFDEIEAPQPDDAQPLMVEALRLMANLKQFAYIDPTWLAVPPAFFRNCTFQLDSLIWRARCDRDAFFRYVLPNQPSLKHLYVHSFVGELSDEARSQAQDMSNTFLPNLRSLEANTATLRELVPVLGRDLKDGPRRSLKRLLWAQDDWERPCNLLSSMSHLVTDVEGFSIREKGPKPYLSEIVEHMPSLVILEMHDLKPKQQVMLLSSLPHLRRFILRAPEILSVERAYHAAKMFFDACPQLEAVDLRYHDDTYRRFDADFMLLVAKLRTEGGDSLREARLSPPVLQSEEVRTQWKDELLHRFCNIDLRACI